MEQLNPSSQQQITLTFKQKIFVLILAVIIVVSIAVLYMQRKKVAEQQIFDETIAVENMQKETDLLQTSIRNNCQSDWEKYCKAHSGAEAYACLKNEVSKLQPLCKSFISGEQ